MTSTNYLQMNPGLGIQGLGFPGFPGFPGFRVSEFRSTNLFGCVLNYFMTSPNYVDVN